MEDRGQQGRQKERKKSVERRRRKRLSDFVWRKQQVSRLEQVRKQQWVERIKRSLGELEVTVGLLSFDVIGGEWHVSVLVSAMVRMQS